MNTVNAQLAVQRRTTAAYRHHQEHPRPTWPGTLRLSVNMSPRHFALVFTEQVGMTPARFVTTVRVETARRLLEETSQPLETVCVGSGLGTPESMRRAFLKAVGIPPGQYRERFSSVPVAPAAATREPSN
jgi:transcriptional regulator GlxA family with amidase domain